MFEISKEFHFSASHQLDGLPTTHPCSRLHGHNYIVRLTLQSHNLNEVGFLRDYRQLNELKRYIDDFWDHRHLNDEFDFNPTAENMARHIYHLAHEMNMDEVAAVSVSETPKTWATYRGDNYA